MKLPFTILAFLLISSQTFAPYLLITLFYSNQNNIASRFCINKARPAMKCNGKCYLKKKIAQVSTEENNNNQQESANINIKSDPFFGSFYTLISINKPLLMNEYITLVADTYCYDFTTIVFHPPYISQTI